MKTGLRSVLVVSAALLGALIVSASFKSNLATASTNESPIPTDPVLLGKHLAEQPNKLSIVLVSTPGCGFCKLVRELQLAPLLKDPDFPDVAVFEVLMRDTTAFAEPVKNFRNHTGTDLGKISSPAELSEKLGIDFAPTVLFIGNTAEVAEPLVGYGVPEYYFAYLSDRIDTARKDLAKPQQN